MMHTVTRVERGGTLTLLGRLLRRLFALRVERRLLPLRLVQDLQPQPLQQTRRARMRERRVPMMM